MKKSQENKKVIEGLTHLLADTYVLYVKTQNFHWNVTGPHFIAYHEMFENQYNELANAVDVLAERIRALNAMTPASLSDFLKMTGLTEAKNNLKAPAMIQTLLKDHEHIAHQIEQLFEVMAAAGDEVTMDILIQRKTAHDKTAWMLRSTCHS